MADLVVPLRVGDVDNITITQRQRNVRGLPIMVVLEAVTVATITDSGGWKIAGAHAKVSILLISSPIPSLKIIIIMSRCCAAVS